MRCAFSSLEWLRSIAGQQAYPKHLLRVSRASDKSNFVSLRRQNWHAAEITRGREGIFFRGSNLSVKRWYGGMASRRPPITAECGKNNEQKGSDCAIKRP